MISAFIFDYGNVISVVDPSVFIQTVKPFSTIPAAELGERLAAAHGLMLAYESGTMGTVDFIPAFLQHFGLAMTQEEFIRAWSGFFTPIPFTRSLIRALKDRYTMALLSNTNPLHFEHVIKPTDVFPLFDAVTLSYEVGAMKPAPEIYRDMLGKLRVPPEECVYLDDLLQNVEAAAALGMQTIHFTTPGAAERQLRALIPDLPGVGTA